MKRSLTNEGFSFPGFQISDEKFASITHLAQIQKAGLADPIRVSKATKKERSQDFILDEAAKLRNLVQRRFDVARINRARAYADYIEACLDGRLRGDYPPINIWVGDQDNFVLHEDDAGSQVLILPWNTALVAIDGETQLAARYILEQRKPETNRTLFPIIFHVGIPAEVAQLRLHDYNRYAHPVSELKLVTANTSGPLTKLTNQVLVDAGWDSGQVCLDGPKPRKGKHEVVSFIQMAAGILGLERGRAAFKDSFNKSFGLLNTPTAQIEINGQGVPFGKVMRANAISKDLHESLWLVAGAYVKERGVEALTPDVLRRLYESWERTKYVKGKPRVKAVDRMNQAFDTIIYS